MGPQPLLSLVRGVPDGPGGKVVAPAALREARRTREDEVQVGETYWAHLPVRENPIRPLTCEKAPGDVDVGLAWLAITLTTPGLLQHLPRLGSSPCRQPLQRGVTVFSGAYS